MQILFFGSNNKTYRDIQRLLESAYSNFEVDFLDCELTEIPPRITHDIIITDVIDSDEDRQLIQKFWQSVSSKTYVILISNDYTRSDANETRVNDILSQPLDFKEFKEKIDNAVFMRKLGDHLTDEQEDFHSAGGVISKSAFKQLFLATLDRARRYGNDASIIIIGLSNFRDILENDGPYAAEYAAAKLSQNLVTLRRQADIIGQTDKHEYTLLLLDPKSSNEPISAANRFAESLSNCSDLYEGGARQADIYVRAVFLPTGICLRDHHFQVARETDIQRD